MQAITRLFLAACAYPRVAPTDHPIDPYCIWNSYLYNLITLAQEAVNSSEIRRSNHCQQFDIKLARK